MSQFGLPPLAASHHASGASHLPPQPHGGSRVTDQNKRTQKWSEEEVHQLQAAISTYTHGRVIDWGQVALLVPGRTGKQCREKYRNDLNPAVSKEPWTLKEEYILARCHSTTGNQWSSIAKYLPGRSENNIKNHWNSTSRSQARNRRRSMLWLYAKLVSEQQSMTCLETFQEACRIFVHEEGQEALAAVSVPDSYFESKTNAHLDVRFPYVAAGSRDTKDSVHRRRTTSDLVGSWEPVAGIAPPTLQQQVDAVRHVVITGFDHFNSFPIQSVSKRTSRDDMHAGSKRTSRDDVSDSRMDISTNDQGSHGRGFRMSLDAADTARFMKRRVTQEGPPCVRDHGLEHVQYDGYHTQPRALLVQQSDPFMDLVSEWRDVIPAVQATAPEGWHNDDLAFLGEIQGSDVFFLENQHGVENQQFGELDPYAPRMMHHMVQNGALLAPSLKEVLSAEIGEASTSHDSSTSHGPRVHGIPRNMPLAEPGRYHVSSYPGTYPGTWIADRRHAVPGAHSASEAWQHACVQPMWQRVHSCDGAGPSRLVAMTQSEGGTGVRADSMHPSAIQASFTQQVTTGLLEQKEAEEAQVKLESQSCRPVVSDGFA